MVKYRRGDTEIEAWIVSSETSEVSFAGRPCSAWERRPPFVAIRTKFKPYPFGLRRNIIHPDYPRETWYYSTPSNRVLRVNQHKHARDRVIDAQFRLI